MSRVNRTFSLSSPAFSLFIGTRRLPAEVRLSLQLFEPLSWPGLVFLNMFLWEAFSVMWLSMKDDQWIINFSRLDPFNSSSVSYVEGGHMILLLGLAPATVCLIYHSKDSPITHLGLLLVPDVHLPSPFSLHCNYQPSALFLSFLCITLQALDPSCLLHFLFCGQFLSSSCYPVFSFCPFLLLTLH